MKNDTDKVKDVINKIKANRKEKKDKREERLEQSLNAAADKVISSDKHSKTEQAVEKKINSKKTSIRARIIRMGLISLVSAAVFFAVGSLVILHYNLRKNAEEELSNLASAYVSAIDNSDIVENKSFIDKLFDTFAATNEKGGFGICYQRNQYRIRRDQFRAYPQGHEL